MTFRLVGLGASMPERTASDCIHWAITAISMFSFEPSVGWPDTAPCSLLLAISTVPSMSRWRDPGSPSGVTFTGALYAFKAFWAILLTFPHARSGLRVLGSPAQAGFTHYAVLRLSLQQVSKDQVHLRVHHHHMRLLFGRHAVVIGGNDGVGRLDNTSTCSFSSSSAAMLSVVTSAGVLSRPSSPGEACPGQQQMQALMPESGRPGTQCLYSMAPDLINRSGWADLLLCLRSCNMM